MVTKCSSNKGFSGYSSILLRLNFCAGGQRSKPAIPYYCYTQPLATIIMKTHILLITLLSFLSEIDAQIEFDSEKDNNQYQVELFYKFDCDNKIKRIENFILEKGNRKYSAINGCCIVPEKGVYSFSDFVIDNLEENQINVRSALQTDTIIVFKIYVARHNAIPPWPYYSICGDPCNGRIIEKWDSGNVRISGKFNNGRIIKYNKYDIIGNLETKIRSSMLFSLRENYENEKLIFRLKRVLIFGSAKVWDPGTNKYYKDDYYKFKE